MRRKLSDELPRFVNTAERLSFQFRRRHALYALFLFFAIWLLRRPGTPTDTVDWSKYAYSLYATDSATLCHAVLIFDALARLGSKADRVLWYPQQWDTKVENSRDRDSQLLVMARDKYKVNLRPVQLLTVEGRASDEWTGTWDKSVSKFFAFSLEEYTRVIALDSDISLLRPIDELFLLPPTPIALPRAYWYKTYPPPLTSMLMVLQPSGLEFGRFKRIMSEGGHSELVANHKFDMELINERFEDSAMVLPHRPYAMLSGEFRTHNHTAYLGNPLETWDAQRIYDEAKLVHFSDWPLPKPWIMWPAEGLAEVQPDCGGSRQGTCAERKIWKGLYEDFRKRRKDVCRLLSVPPPDWKKVKGEIELHGEVKGSKEVVNATEGTGTEAPQVGSRGEELVEE